MERWFGRAAAAGGVKHERWILRRSIRSREFLAVSINPGVPLCAGHPMQVNFIFADDYNRNLRAHAGGRQKFQKSFGRDNRRARLAFFEVMNLIARARART